MRAEVDRKSLVRALRLLLGVVPKRTIRPILQQVHVSVLEGVMTLQTTDLERRASVCLLAREAEDGAATVPAREFGEVVRGSKNAIVVVALHDDAASRRIVVAGVSLTGEDPETFPEAPDTKYSKVATVGVAAFREVLRRTTFAVASEETRYAVNGLRLRLEGDSLQAAATDGWRLSVACAASYWRTSAAAAVIPLSTAELLQRALPKTSDDLNFWVSENVAYFSWCEGASTFAVQTQLLVSRFPDVEGVIPTEKDCRTWVKVDAVALAQAVSQAAAGSSDDMRCVVLHVEDERLGSGKELRVTGECTTKHAEGAAEVLDGTGPSCSVGMNPDFLLEALKHAEGTVWVGFQTESKGRGFGKRRGESLRPDELPVRFDLPWTYVLMPISGS